MKKALSIICLAALVAGSGMNVQAQFRNSFFLNGGLPVGGFAGDVNASRYVTYYNGLANQATFANVPLGYQEIAKGATAGFGAGYRASYRFDVGVGMVAPFAQADLFVNFCNSDISSEYGKVRGTAPTYFNVPLQVGITYMYDELPSDVIPYGEIGLGADLLFITKEGGCQYTDALTNARENTITFNYKPSTSFAFSIGAGAYFGRHVSAGVYYYFMGTHPLDYTKGTENNLSNILAPAADQPAGNPAYSEYDYYMDNAESRNIGTFALRIGFHF